MAESNFDKYRETVQELKSAMERNDEAATKRLNDVVSDFEGKMRDMERAANRPAAGEVESKADAEYKTAFNQYLRSGNIHEFKAATATQADNSGYVTVPSVLAAAMKQSLVDISPLRQLADVQTVETPNFALPFATGGTASMWVGEKDARPATSTDTITEVVPQFGELWARPMATQQLIEDSQYDIAGFIASRAVQEFNRAEGAAFVNGDGAKKPTGILNVTNAATADATRAFGTVQYVPSGIAAGLTGTGQNGADALINLVMSLKAGYRSGASFIMNKATLGVVRQFKDQYGQYLWQPSTQAGIPSKLLDYPVYEAEDMPGIAANSTPILFGDIKQSYMIADRIGFSVQYDPLTAVPYVAWNVRKRVGGCPVDTQAYKLLKVAAS